MEPNNYLSMAFQRLDLLLQREILRLRASYQLSLDEFRGLYISDEQVNQHGGQRMAGMPGAIHDAGDVGVRIEAEEF